MSPDTAPVIGIAADDLTGANDSVVQFAKAGWTSRLALGDLPADKPGEATALALVTDARALDTGAAASATADAVTRLLRAGATYLYLKVDSTMRGSVAGQIDGALSAWGKQHEVTYAVLCPAYPAMGRTLEDGVIKVNGESVEHSAAGRDPVTPVVTGYIQHLVPRSSTPVRGYSAAGYVEGIAAAAQNGSEVVAVDAATDEDLDMIAVALQQLGPHCIPAGSAGLAGAMASIWAEHAGATGGQASPVATGSGTILIIVSSLHDVSRNQSEQLVKMLPPDQLQVLRPEPADLEETAVLEDWLSRRTAEAPSVPVRLVLSPPSTTPSLTAAQIAQRLGAMARLLLDTSQVKAFVLVGGDGARAVLDACGTRSILVSGAIEEGVPLGTIEGGSAEGLHVVTKAGGFGKPESLVAIVEKLLK